MSTAMFGHEIRVDPCFLAQIHLLESVRPGLAKRLVDVFRTNTLEFLTQVDSYLLANDLETLRIGFHSLKGAAGSLGAKRLACIADLAERVIEGKSSASLGELIDCARAEYDEVHGELAALVIRKSTNAE
jgi:HPt (histidine-containing phosphotransfer) domain-containing protein